MSPLRGFFGRGERAAAQRRQLEGGAELLEQALPTYRLLLRTLERTARGVSLRGAASSARSVIALDADIETSLSAAHRQFERGDWRPFDEVPRLVVKVERARRGLSHAANQRVAPRPPDTAPLGYLLGCLFEVPMPEESALPSPVHRATLAFEKALYRRAWRVMRRWSMVSVASGIGALLSLVGLGAYDFVHHTRGGAPLWLLIPWLPAWGSVIWGYTLRCPRCEKRFIGYLQRAGRFQYCHHCGLRSGAEPESSQGNE